MITVEGDSVTLIDPTGGVIHTNLDAFIENCVILGNSNKITVSTVLHVLGAEITVKDLPPMLKKTIVKKLQSGENRRSKM